MGSRTSEQSFHDSLGISGSLLSSPVASSISLPGTPAQQHQNSTAGLPTHNNSFHDSFYGSAHSNNSSTDFHYSVPSSSPYCSQRSFSPTQSPPISVHSSFSLTSPVYNSPVHSSSIQIPTHIHSPVHNSTYIPIPSPSPNFFFSPATVASQDFNSFFPPPHPLLLSHSLPPNIFPPQTLPFHSAPPQPFHPFLPQNYYYPHPPLNFYQTAPQHHSSSVSFYNPSYIAPPVPPRTVPPVPPPPVPNIVSPNVPCVAPPIRCITPISHIAPLEGSANFEHWDDSIRSFLDGAGFLPHIYDPSVDFPDPTIVPSYRPVLSLSPTKEELQAAGTWRSNDSQVKHILLNKLSSQVSGTIAMVKHTTAREIYNELRKSYSSRDWVGGKEIWDGLVRLRPNGDAVAYCRRWISDFGRVCMSKYLISTTQALTTFYASLPSSGPILINKCEALRSFASDPNVSSSFFFQTVNNLIDQITLLNFKLSTANPRNGTNQSPNMNRPSQQSNRSSRNNHLQQNAQQDNPSASKPKAQVNLVSSVAPELEPVPDDGGVIEIILEDGGDDEYGFANVILPVPTLLSVTDSESSPKVTATSGDDYDSGLLTHHPFRAVSTSSPMNGGDNGTTAAKRTSIRTAKDQTFGTEIQKRAKAKMKKKNSGIPPKRSLQNIQFPTPKRPLDNIQFLMLYSLMRKLLGLKLLLRSMFCFLSFFIGALRCS